MNKGTTTAIAIIVIIVVIAGGYAILHKPKTTTSGSSATSSAPAVNNAVLVTKTDATVGQYLAGSNGKPLYTYNADTSGVSNCTGSCLANWPAYQDTGSKTGLPAGVSTITRSDNGQVQYTYNGMPLYYFVGDSQGKVTGNGVENFTIAKPAAAASSSSSTSTPSTSSTPSATPTPTPSPSSSSSSGSSYNY